MISFSPGYCPLPRRIKPAVHGAGVQGKAVASDSVPKERRKGQKRARARGAKDDHTWGGCIYGRP